MHFDLRLYLSKFQNTADFSDSFFYINFGINIILYTLYTPESVPIKYNAFFLRNHPAKPHTVLPPSKLYFARYFDEFQALLLCALHCSHFSGNKVLSCHTKCDALCHIRPVPCKIPTASKPVPSLTPFWKTNDTSPHLCTDTIPLYSAPFSDSTVT